jgi:hypothetical protein
MEKYGRSISTNPAALEVYQTVMQNAVDDAVYQKKSSKQSLDDAAKKSRRVALSVCPGRRRGARGPAALPLRSLRAPFRRSLAQLPARRSCGSGSAGTRVTIGAAGARGTCSSRRNGHLLVFTLCRWRSPYLSLTNYDVFTDWMDRGANYQDVFDDEFLAGAGQYTTTRSWTIPLAWPWASRRCC